MFIINNYSRNTLNRSVVSDIKLLHTPQSTPKTQAISVALDSVIFTGQVPHSSWNFNLSIADKLWISERTTLYFGQETRINRTFYRDKLFVQDQQLTLNMDLVVYNSYGEIIKKQASVHFYALDKAVPANALLRVEQDWTQLLFNFRLTVDERRKQNIIRRR